MRKKRFKTELLSGHKEDAIEVPFDPATAWESVPTSLWRGRRGYEVRGTVNGFPFDSCIVARQKRFFMLVHANVKLATKVSVGDIVTATVEPLSK